MSSTFIFCQIIRTIIQAWYVCRGVNLWLNCQFARKQMFPNIYATNWCQFKCLEYCFQAYQIFISHQMISFSKLWKMFFISSKKLFSFSGCFCISVFFSFFPVSHCFRGWFKRILKVYDVIICLNENLITRFVWYLEKEIRCDIETLSIDRELNKEHFYGKIMQKMCTKS